MILCKYMTSLTKFIQKYGYARVEIISGSKADFIFKRIEAGYHGLDHEVFKSIQTIYSDIFKCSQKEISPRVEKIVQIKMGRGDDSCFSLKPESNYKGGYSGYLSLNNTDSKFVCWPGSHTNRDLKCTVDNAKYLDIKAGVFVLWDNMLYNCFLPPSKCIPLTKIYINAKKQSI